MVRARANFRLANDRGFKRGHGRVVNLNATCPGSMRDADATRIVDDDVYNASS